MNNLILVYLVKNCSFESLFFNDPNNLFAIISSDVPELFMNCPKYFTFSFADIIVHEISTTILSFSSLDNNSHLSGFIVRSNLANN